MDLATLASTSVSAAVSSMPVPSPSSSAFLRLAGAPVEAFPFPFELTDRPFVTEPGPVATLPRFEGRMSSSPEDTGIASIGLGFCPALLADPGAILRLVDGPDIMVDPVRVICCSD